MNEAKKKWSNWVKESYDELPETAKKFVEEAEIVAIKGKEIMFDVRGKEFVFRKNNKFSWTMPSSLFVEYGVFTSLMKGFNEVLAEFEKTA